MLNFSKTQVFPWVKFLLVCLFIVVSIASCYNRVADILRSQQDYTNKVVTIEGVVTESLSIAGIGYFKISDGSGATITVLPSITFPKVGDKVVIKGIVTNLAVLGENNLVGIKELKEP